MLTISSRVYKALADSIIGGVLKPGQKLEEKALAQQFGVSRTPIREALRELAARGLVDFSPRRGGVVAEIGVEKLADMLEAQCELEALCARLASQRMSSVEKGQLQDIFERTHAVIRQAAVAEYLALNQEMHSQICAGAHNDTLRAMASELRDRLAPFRQAQVESDEERLARSDAEHAAIVGAIVRGEAEEAYQAMRNHNARLSSGVIRVLRGRPEAVRRVVSPDGGAETGMLDLPRL
jgi:DNA-binding GntR family transcriptional regulator